MSTKAGARINAAPWRHAPRRYAAWSHAGPRVYAVVLAGLTAFVLMHSLAVERRLSFLSGIPMGPATTAALDRGESLPRLPQVRALDSFLWIDHAKGLAEDGAWRLRHTDFDNAPAGRPVRWHSGLALWMVGLGRIWSRIEGVPVAAGIERAAVFACPLLFLGVVFWFSFAAYRRWGALAAVSLAIAMVASGDFYGGFLPGEPDHHGLAAACALGTVLGIVLAGAGWVRGPVGGDKTGVERFAPRDIRTARAGMVLSAVSGSAGLWISAVSQSLVFVAVGIGFLLCLLVGRERENVEPHSQDGFHPELWRFWGRLGAVLALGFYAFEYMPDALSWHVETNHPLYALAWLFGGELLAMAGSVADSRRGLEPRQRLTRAEWVRASVAALGVVLPALWVVVGGARSHALRDPFLQKLHAMIVEFMPFVTSLKYGGGGLEAIGATPVVIMAGLALLWRRRTPALERRMLIFTLSALAMVTIARFYQARWGSVWGGVLVAMTPVVAVSAGAWLRERFGTARAWMVGAVAVVLAMVLSPWRIYTSDREYANQTEELTLDELHALVLREVAYRLQETHRGSNRPIVVLTGPDATVQLVALGRSLAPMSGIGTLYWENVDGLRAAAETVTAAEELEARRLIEARGVTHVLLVEWEDFTSGYYELPHRRSGAGVALSATFGRRIGNPSSRPTWLREVPVGQIERAQEMGLRVLLLAVAS